MLLLVVILNVSVLSLRGSGEESGGILCGLEAGSVVDMVNLIYTCSWEKAGLNRT
jgi:hypothetical protein